MAGYARRAGGAGPQIELTPHAREWIDRIWEPLRHRGTEMLAAFSPEELSLIVSVLRAACEVQERHLADLRRWLDEPAAAGKAINGAACRRPPCGAFRSSSRRTSIVRSTSRSRQSRRTQRPSLRTCVQDVDRRNPPRVYRAASNRARPGVDRQDRSAAGRDCGRHGLRNAESLTTAFRRATGFTPAAYRRGRRSRIAHGRA